MPKRAPDLALPDVGLVAGGGVPLRVQLEEGLRDAILTGRLAAGARLPSTRAMAAGLRVSRTTVLAAFDRLLAEGYLVGRVGAGTYVARAAPSPRREPDHAAPDLSRRGAVIARTRVSPPAGGGSPVPFRTGVPAVDRFPADLWGGLAATCLRDPRLAGAGYPDPAGYPPLRAAVALYLTAQRAVRCTPEQVLIVTGSQQAIDLTARVLLDPGDPVWIEDPGYLGVRGALLAAGARVLPVPVDGEGFRLGWAVGRHRSGRLAYVTPSHQYPLGVTMSLPRRLALLDWAARDRGWILEDDYDSEYRYTGKPLAALQGLDRSGRVIYTGTLAGGSWSGVGGRAERWRPPPGCLTLARWPPLGGAARGRFAWRRAPRAVVDRNAAHSPWRPCVAGRAFCSTP